MKNLTIKSELKMIKIIQSLKEFSKPFTSYWKRKLVGQGYTHLRLVSPEKTQTFSIKKIVYSSDQAYQKIDEIIIYLN